MTPRESKSSLIKLPTNIELVLYLIREELKNNKLFTGLAQAGLEDCYYQSFFGEIVLLYMGFEDLSDDLLKRYSELIDQYTQKVEADHDIITDCTFKMYNDLLTLEKNKQKVNKSNSL